MTHKIGFIGYRNHAKKLLDIVEEEDFEVSQIYHPTKNIEDSRITNNLEDLYECDAVVIASPNSTHFDYIQNLIENSNCLIYCEKPPVTSYESIKYLEELTEENKKRIFFGFNLRFSKFNDIIKQYSNSEKLGKIIQINIITSMGFAFKEKYLGSWRADGKNNLHNILENSSIHWIDLMIFIFGEYSNSDYFPRLVSNNGTSYDTNSVILEFKNGVACSIFTSYATPLIENIIIVGTNGFITIRDDTLEIFSPRDSFDKNGLFKKPPSECIDNFNCGKSVQESLKKSINYFLEHVEKSKKFDLNNFEKSILSNKLALTLQSRRN